jgi:hypothetical protein
MVFHYIGASAVVLTRADGGSRKGAVHSAATTKGNEQRSTKAKITMAKQQLQ